MSELLPPWRMEFEQPRRQARDDSLRIYAASQHTYTMRPS
jgi:hypothetical protein